MQLQGFYVKEARLGGIDVLNRPLRINGPEAGALEIVVSPNFAAIDGKVTDSRLEPVPSAQVVLVPDHDRARSQLFKAAITDQNGRFSISNIEPGDYKLFAWEALEPYAYFDPELLRQSEPKATSVHVAELSKQTIELKAMPLP